MTSGWWHPWNKGISLTKPPFEVRSCEVAIIWPDIYIYIYPSVYVLSYIKIKPLLHGVEAYWNIHVHHTTLEYDISHIGLQILWYNAWILDMSPGKQTKSRLFWDFQQWFLDVTIYTSGHRSSCLHVNILREAQHTPVSHTPGIPKLIPKWFMNSES